MTHHTITDEKRAALDAFQFLVSNARPRVEINQRHIDTIEAALTTPPDNVGDEVVEEVVERIRIIRANSSIYNPMQTVNALEKELDILIPIAEEVGSLRYILDESIKNCDELCDEVNKLRAENVALIKKNGGG